MNQAAAKASIVHETVVRLGEQRGAPRYFCNTRYLQSAGFERGQYLSISIAEGLITIRKSEQPTGKRVQEKCGKPLIDLNARFLQTVFGVNRTVHVRVGREEIILSVHPIETARRERLRDRSAGSIFSGAGLLDQAAVDAGYTCRWSVEIDRRTADVFAENHPGATVYEMSAHEAAFADLQPVELLALGLPCQPWSRARTLNSDGSKRDFSRPATEHPLGDMAMWAFLIIARTNPRTVLIECAPAFDGSEVCASLAGALRRLNYKVEHRVVNAADHGALTKRRRTVLVAMTPESDGQTPDPWPKQTPASATVSSILDTTVPDELWWDRETKPWVFRVNERNAEKGSGFGFQVVHPHSTSIGVLTSEYGETKNDQPVVAHPTKPDTYRYFTVAEGRRIFGLPASYVLPQAKTFAWRLMGQGVYVPLFKEIIRQATAQSPAEGHSGVESLPLFSMIPC